VFIVTSYHWSISGNVIFVATVNNTVYAFNGNDVSMVPHCGKVISSCGAKGAGYYDLKDVQNGQPCGGIIVILRQI